MCEQSTSISFRCCHSLATWWEIPHSYIYVCRLDRRKPAENTCVSQCCHVPFPIFLAYPATTIWNDRKKYGIHIMYSSCLFLTLRCKHSMIATSRHNIFRNGTLLNFGKNGINKRNQQKDIAVCNWRFCFTNVISLGILTKYLKTLSPFVVNLVHVGYLSTTVVIY